MPAHVLFAAALMLALLTFGLAGWATVFARRLAGLPIVPLEPRRPVPWTLVDLLAILAGFVLLQIAAALVLRGQFGADLMERIEEGTAAPGEFLAIVLAQGVASLLIGCIALGVVVARAGASARDVGVVGEAFARDVALGIAAFFTLALPVLAIQAALVQWYPSEHPLIEILRASPSPWMFAATVFVAVVVAPVVEEFLFRVVLQGWLEKIGRADPLGALPPKETFNDSGNDAFDNLPSDLPYWPIFVSAAVFALLHAGHGPDPIPLFLLAVGLGYLYRQTHRIAPCIAVHLLLNGMSMAALWMQLITGE